MVQSLYHACKLARVFKEKNDHTIIANIHVTCLSDENRGNELESISVLPKNVCSLQITVSVLLTLVIILSRAQDTNVIFVGAQVLFFLYENDLCRKIDVEHN